MLEVALGAEAEFACLREVGERFGEALGAGGEMVVEFEGLETQLLLEKRIEDDGGGSGVFEASNETAVPAATDSALALTCAMTFVALRHTSTRALCRSSRRIMPSPTRGDSGSSAASTTTSRTAWSRDGRLHSGGRIRTPLPASQVKTF